MGFYEIEVPVNYSNLINGGAVQELLFIVKSSRGCEFRLAESAPSVEAII